MLALQPVMPLGAHQLLIFVLQVGLLLMLALLLGRLAARLGMPAIVGELAVGVLLGPSLLAHVAPAVSDWLLPREAGQFHLLDAVAQIGVLLLVGLTGIQLDFKLVRRRGATAAKISIAGLVIPLGFGIATGYLLPASLLADNVDVTVFAMFLGVAMCVSAIPVIAKTLMDMNLLHRNVGQLCLTAGMLDDAFGWFMLSVVSGMATTGIRASGIALSLLLLVAVVVFAIVVGRPLVRVVMRNAREPGTAVVAVVVMVLLSAAGTHALGLEAILGAFVCGILIGRSGRVEAAWLAPLHTVVLSVLAPLFFATAGLRMDLTRLAEPSVLAAAAVVLVVAIAGKFLGAYIGARLSRLTRWEALALGAGMNARGVVEVIVAMVGLRLGVLNDETYTIIVLVAIVTSLMAPPILRFTMNRVEQTAEERLRLAEHDELVR
ncbi:cation:proton antiporter [Streptosporangium subroseum]|uniref:cation:proton antiporter n=1 Tax=Streptosporangium subroseum TaxID=106412 RepID=UPI0030855976|nr:cation:proton antiporter [Streptosporangium subroseum]